MAWWSILGGTAVTAAERLVTGVGKGVGSVLNRVGWTEKLSDKEKWSMLIEMGNLDQKDADMAREVFMTEMKTQKLPWFVRFFNGMFRPLCGYASMLYLFEPIWAQAINQFALFHWEATAHNAVTDLCALSIVGFFFGLRQRSKEKAVTDVS